MGLVIHTNAIATGKLAEKIIALGAANNIWNGTGIKAQNKPTAKALEIDFRLKFHKLALTKYLLNQPSDLWLLSSFWLGL
ncbi:hypothetical protein BBROOKSOX_377 [Bathymodiolus brooksi thiotrophic gill symbiont]|nr:hypothetical protein BBROOKSOX_377 [Bathymodiolus brooksi thiotrophic gill symbiont]